MTWWWRGLPAWLLAAGSLCCAAEPIVLQHHDGEELVLDQPAKRLITLAPHLAELVFSAGAGEQLLATVEYSDYPEAAAQRPRIGDAFRFDMERILALKPDLVLVWQSGNPLPAQRRLADLGLRTWRTEIRHPAEMAELIEAIGRATGNSPAATLAAAEVRATLDSITRQFAGRTSLSYFFQISDRPLYTVNGEHLISQGLALCGARNAFADLDGLAPQINAEAVLEANPETLIAARFRPEDEPLRQWTTWPRLQAVQRGALIYLDANRISRATPRMLDSIRNACNLLDRYRPATG